MIAGTRARSRIGSGTAAHRHSRRGPFVVLVLAVGLACVSGVALAIVGSTAGEVREWIEFRAPRGVGVAEGTWLRASPSGYADLHMPRDPVSVGDAVRAVESAPSHTPPQCWTRSPREATYVDLAGLPTHGSGASSTSR